MFTLVYDGNPDTETHSHDGGETICCYLTSTCEECRTFVASGRRIVQVWDAIAWVTVADVDAENPWGGAK